jgi:hypothetical protein
MAFLSYAHCPAEYIRIEVVESHAFNCQFAVLNIKTVQSQRRPLALQHVINEIRGDRAQREPP